MENSRILERIDMINTEQSVKNEDIFGAVDNNNTLAVIVVQVHDRLQYLRQLIISFSQVGLSLIAFDQNIDLLDSINVVMNNWCVTFPSIRFIYCNNFSRRKILTEPSSYLVMMFGTKKSINSLIQLILPKYFKYFTHTPSKHIATLFQGSHQMIAQEMPKRISKY